MKTASRHFQVLELHGWSPSNSAVNLDNSIGSSPFWFKGRLIHDSVMGQRVGHPVASWLLLI